MPYQGGAPPLPPGVCRPTHDRPTALRVGVQVSRLYWLDTFNSSLKQASEFREFRPSIALAL